MIVLINRTLIGIILMPLSSKSSKAKCYNMPAAVQFTE